MSEATNPLEDTNNRIMDTDDTEGWIRITSRRRRQSKHKHLPHAFVLRPSELSRSHVLMDTLDDCDWDALVKKYNATRSHYLNSQIGRSFVDGLLESLNQAYQILSNDELKFESISVLCLGLGNPSTDEASMRQLAVLDALLSLEKRFSRSQTQIYDPLLQSGSRQLIEKIGMQVLTDNNEGCYSLDPQSYHFVFLPHCAPALLNNLLLTNWNPSIIGRLVLYSNGWSQIREELLAAGETESLIAQNLHCIHALEPVLVLPGKQMYLNLDNGRVKEHRSFEAMRIQCFPPTKLKELPNTIWNKSFVRFSHTDTETLYDTKSSERFYSDLITKELIPNYVDQLIG